MESTLGVGNRTTIVTERRVSRKDCEVPKLKTPKCDDYAKWRIGISWWTRLTKMEKKIQAPHVTLNSILTPEVNDVAVGMKQEDAEAENAMENLLAVLDDYFKPNTFVRKIKLWHQFGKCKKTSDISWHGYIKRMKKLRNDLSRQNLTINIESYCLALIDASNLDPNQKLNLESTARSSNPEQVLTLNDTEQAILRMKGLEAQYEHNVLAMSESHDFDDDNDPEVNWMRQGQRKKRQLQGRLQIFRH